METSFAKRLPPYYFATCFIILSCFLVSAQVHEKVPLSQLKHESIATQVTEVQAKQCSNLKSTSAMFGVTITDIDQAAAAIPKLRLLAASNETVPVVVRIVFNPIKESKPKKFDDRLREYKQHVKELRDGVSDGKGICILGTIADSYSMHFYLPDKTDSRWPKGYRNYEKWTERLVGEMVDERGDLVDIWEVGNEVNGEWHGWEDNKYKHPDQRINLSEEWQNKRSIKRNRIMHELRAGFDSVKRLRPNGLTAVTLLYNADGATHCAEFPEYKMKEWAGEYLVPGMRDKVDFVFLSYYENTQDCPEVTNVTKDQSKLLNVLISLRELFKGEQTAFGFGEISYKQTCYRKDKPEDEIEDSQRIDNAECQSGQVEYINRYYKDFDKKISAAVKAYRPESPAKEIRFVGGYFFWYFLQDLVLSKDQKAWDALHTSRAVFRKD
jgi:hypothetical protein